MNFWIRFSIKMSFRKDIRSTIVGYISLVALAVTFTSPLAQSLAQGQRDRRVVADPSPSPGLQPAITPATSRPSTAPENAPRTLADLQSRIGEIVRQPALEPGFFAAKIVSLETGNVIFEQNANKFVRPASNMKLYTVAAALDRLTPDYHFITTVYSREQPDKGTVKGDLIVYGRGDPSIAARFNNSDYFKGINDLADRVVAAGVKRVKGDLVGDESYFNGAPLGSGWEWEDLTWSYGAQVSALSINDNAIDLSVKPGGKVGAPCIVSTGPPAAFMTFANRATTSPRGSKSELTIYRGLGTNTLEITGTLPLGDFGFFGGVAIPDPALAFVTMFRDALTKRGVKIEGRSRTVNARSGGTVIVAPPLTAAPQNISVPSDPAQSNVATAQPAPVEIASLQSPPFSLIAAHTLKPSQNLYTELILRTLGKNATTPNVAAVNGDTAQDHEKGGLGVVRSFLLQAGVGENELALSDGSGLSRNDLVSVNATVQLLTFMSKHRFAQTFRDALPVAGVDGTLRTRMRGTAAEGNLAAKTGTLSSVASLSGYVTTAAGERLVFSMMLNNYPDANALRRDSIDAIAVLLASFTGRSQ
jgi:D-alanyl-D-alanine carboxypeptidase/D-alanyl-D-alanine-endopeptidase (penicillin-binding protein 4)